ncbi:calaxin-like [Uloborus diversus]|uniref:calaxin-like n=1 Tax=Uloborus diversus TaxID=327109 RepID=UPI00240A2091|nr:calaxin-like [Uloborus diversus]
MVIISENDLKYLIKTYQKYTNQHRYLGKSKFLEVLHITFGYIEPFFMNRVFLLADTNKDGRIDVEEFIRLFSILLRGTKEEQIDFCFNCYDISEASQLSRDTIIILLSQTSVQQTDATLEMNLDLLDMVLSKMDQDGDGVLSYEEYKNAALNDWLLMEVFGQCLPDYKSYVAFVEKMENHVEPK